ncbi:unnamed protein product [Toxocara canis]|uniref:Voltage-dependent L-type calcium channel subunit beta-2 n=1 Tax=Toxocara canis TaxID=6265 RepID=A0A183U1W3_TOXCA|nr:unnamed protein product [Toxocara canis]
MATELCTDVAVIGTSEVQDAIVQQVLTEWPMSVWGSLASLADQKLSVQLERRKPLRTLLPLLILLTRLMGRRAFNGTDVATSKEAHCQHSAKQTKASVDPSHLPQVHSRGSVSPVGFLTGMLNNTQVLESYTDSVS